MLTPVVCFTCGSPIGDVAPLYLEVLRARNAQRAPGGAAPYNRAIDPGQRENMMEDVLDALRVHKCCRTRLITAMQFCDHY